MPEWRYLMLIKKKFIGRDKNKVLRKVLYFWYRYFKDTCDLKDFILKCKWGMEGKEHVIVYSGSPPTNGCINAGKIVYR
jgi:hypothetical protein